MTLFVFSPPPFDNAASDLVQDGWTQAQGYASDAFSQATGFLNELTALAESLADLPTIDVSLTPPDTSIDTLNLPDAPTEPDTATNLPTTPTAPTYTLPTDPTLLNVNVPGAPSIDLPVWDATAPVAPNPVSTSMSYTESSYTSTLLTNLQTTLADWVSGAATGIDADVEQAIWDRARGREDKIASAKQTEIARTFAGRGFPLPTGVMAQAMLAAIQEAQDKSSSLSRDIAIKQAELEQSNRQFAFQQSVALEGQLLTYTNAVAQRAYDYVKAAAELILQAYDGDVRKYAADVQAYGVRAQALDSLVKRALAPLEAFKGEIDGQKLISELNRQNTEVYKAKLEAVQVVQGIYKTDVDAYSAHVGAEVDRVKALAAVYESTTRGYTAQVDAEATKIRTQADVYRAESDVAVAQANLAIEGAKANLQLLVQKSNLLIEAIKGGAQVAAQIAASALSSVNLSANIGSNESKSLGTSYNMSSSASESESTSTVHSYSHDAS